MNLKGRSLKIILGILSSVALMSGIAYYFFMPRSEIVEFQYDRDAKGVLKIFYDDWYWLFPGDDYSPEYILENRAPSSEWYQRKYKGKLNIKVLRRDGKIAGFTTYYKKNYYEGVIQFIAVAPDFRRQGLATKLTVYAIDQLFKMGLPKVTLTTRRNNPARRIYEGLGFTMTGDDGNVDAYDQLVFYKIDEKTFRDGLKKGISPKKIEGLGRREVEGVVDPGALPA